ncbi:MAG: Ldh family oxidoreductase [Alphaproteobacteria bacterium]|nr:Ldh family oxidoreductase [Alphaproteobacteria bacterium]
MLVAVEEVRKLAESILLAHGVPASHAKTQAGLFIEAEMRAIPSHGLLRLRRVIERIRAGLSVPGATGAQTWTARCFLSVDGERGLGPVVAMAALDTIIPRAREDGIAIAAIRNTNHLGALAYYAEHVATRGLTCIALTISEALVHPWGGRKAMIGTNPIAIGVPADPTPMVLDMATGLVSMGKIHDHANRGAPIPLGWALDEKGDPTTDASAAKKGAIAPFGGPKGYALGIAFEVLVASLAASAIGTDVKGTLDSVHVSNKGDLFIVIAPPHAEAAKALVSDYLETIRAAAPADPAHPVLAPGDRAHAARAQSIKRGMFIDDGLWADLQKLSQESKKEMS